METLPGREVQYYEVEHFLSSHLLEKQPGSLYISGAPGTGKTAVVSLVLEQIKKKTKFNYIFINCMRKMTETDIYERIYDEIPNKRRKVQKTQQKNAKDNVQDRLFSRTANMIVIVLDEMDQVGSKQVLYTLFDWARLPGSKLILIGIANALDLTVRHLPFLNLNASPVKGQQAPICSTLSFPPYQKEDIERIIKLKMEDQNFNPTAVKFVAAKVAASTGDVRKALQACKEVLLDDQVGVAAVNKALQTKKDDGPLPLLQVTILAALLRIHREAPSTRDPLADGVNKSIPMPVLYKQYRKLCSLKGLSWIEESELPMICDILQDRTLVSVVNPVGKRSIGSRKFGSPSSSASGANKIGVLFDPKFVESLVAQSDMKTLFC